MLPDNFSVECKKARLQCAGGLFIYSLKLIMLSGVEHYSRWLPQQGCNEAAEVLCAA